MARVVIDPGHGGPKKLVDPATTMRPDPQEPWKKTSQCPFH